MPTSLPLESLPDWPRRMSLRVAAAYIGVSPSKFDREVRAKKYPQGEKDGGNRYWYREDLDATLDRRKEAGTPSGAALVRERLGAGKLEAR